MRDANTRSRQILDCRQRRQRIGHHVERRIERQRAKCCSYSDWGDGSGTKGWEARKGFEELGLQVRGRVHLYNTRLYDCNHLMTAMKLYNSSSHPHYRFPNIRHTSITNRKHNQTSHFNKSVRLHAPWNNLFNTVKTSQKVYKQTENAAENNSSQKKSSRRRITGHSRRAQRYRWLCQKSRWLPQPSCYPSQQPLSDYIFCVN